MFNRKAFADLLKKAIGERTTTAYADITGVNRTYISKLLNKKLSNPPSPDIIRKLADAAYGVTYEEFMAAAGYLTPIDEESWESLKLHTKKLGPKLLQVIYDNIPKYMPSNYKDIDLEELKKILKNLILEGYEDIPMEDKIQFSTALRDIISYYHLVENKKQIELLDALEDNNTNITAGGQPLTQEQRVNLLAAIDNLSSFEKRIEHQKQKTREMLDLYEKKDKELDILKDKQQRVESAISDDPELLNFWQELKHREDLQLLLKQVRPLPPDAIKRIIKYIKMVEDEESMED